MSNAIFWFIVLVVLGSLLYGALWCGCESYHAFKEAVHLCP